VKATQMLDCHLPLETILIVVSASFEFLVIKELGLDPFDVLFVGCVSSSQVLVVVKLPARLARSLDQVILNVTAAIVSSKYRGVRVCPS